MIFLLLVYVFPLFFPVLMDIWTNKELMRCNNLKAVQPIRPKPPSVRPHLCEKEDGIARGNKVSVIPRSLMDRLTMKNSAGFSVDRL